MFASSFPLMPSETPERRPLIWGLYFSGCTSRLFNLSFQKGQNGFYNRRSGPHRPLHTPHEHHPAHTFIRFLFLSFHSYALPYTTSTLRTHSQLLHVTPEHPASSHTGWHRLTSASHTLHTLCISLSLCSTGLRVWGGAAFPPALQPGVIPASSFLHGLWTKFFPVVTGSEKWDINEWMSTQATITRWHI